MPLMTIGAGRSLLRSLASFTEKWVTFQSAADRLEKSTNLSADSKTALMFVSVDFSGTHGGISSHLLGQANASYLKRAADGTAEVIWKDTGGTSIIVMFGATEIVAERANILVALDADATSRIMVWREGAGAWSAQGTDATGGGANLEFTAAGFAIAGRNNADQVAAFDGNMSRAVMWTGITVPDVTQASVQDNFCNSSTGVLVDPATSVAAYGTPIFDFYGTAAEWNDVSANRGSSTGWAMVGAVVDA